MSQTDRQQRKQRYHAVLRTIALNSGGPQQPGIRPDDIKTHIGGQYGRFDSDAIDTTLQAARENDDIIEWPDAEGQTRITLRTMPDVRVLLEHADAELDWPEAKLERLEEVVREVRDYDE